MLRFPSLLSKCATALAFLLVLTAGVARAQNAATCESQRINAERAYFNGEFDRTIALFESCIAAGIYHGEDAVLAHTLSARSHLALGQDEKARELISALFIQNPEYVPDFRLPPPFRSLIAEVKADMIADGRLLPPGAPVEPEPDLIAVAPDSLVLPTPSVPERRSNRRFLFVGGGALAAAGVTTAILLSGGGDGGGTQGGGLAGPPGRPTGQ